MPSSERQPVFSVMLLMVACFGLGFIGAEGTIRGVGGWFLTIERPSWTAPFWLFVPLSTLLCGLMAIATWNVLQSDHPRRALALWLFWTQLALASAWSWLFFSFNLLGVSAIEVGVSLICAIATVVLFFKVKPAAGWLLIPCVVWLAYTASMSFQIYKLNRGSPPLNVATSPSP